MIPILYESTETAFASNGLCRLRDALSVEVSEERNGLFECNFQYPIDGANYGRITCGRIIYVTHDDSGIPQPFDIVSYSAPVNGVVTFHAVHISYRQSGIVARATGINSLDDAFRMFVETAQPENPFIYSADFESTAYFAAADGTPRSVRQMLGGIEGSILDSYGGEYEWDRFNVKLHRNRGVHRDFTIRYGVNLLDYKDDTDYSGTYSSCIPYWSGDNGNGGTKIVYGSRVDSGLVTYNGRNICAPLDLTDKFETEPTVAQLETMAQAYMTSHQPNAPQQNITVDFVRLQDYDEYAGFADLMQCHLCDTINVVFPMYGMSGSYKIVKTVWDVLEGRYKEMELGALSTSLAQALGISETTKGTSSGINNLSIGGDLSVGGDASVIGTVSAANPVDPTDLVTKQYMEQHHLKLTTVSRTFVAQSAGARSYFQVNWGETLPSTPVSVIVHTSGVSAVSGAQFTPVNVSTTGAYISYYCPAATQQATLIIRAYYYE